VTGLPQTQPPSKPLPLLPQVIILFIAIVISVPLASSFGEAVAQWFGNDVVFSNRLWLFIFGFEAVILAGLFTYCYRRRERRRLQAFAIAFSLYFGMIILWFVLWRFAGNSHFGF
jgi:hypothetical protein